MIRVTEEYVAVQEVINSLSREVHGAVVTFLGTVRLWTGDRKVLYLDYEAYPQMAEEQLRLIVNEGKLRPEVEDIAIYHRIGRLTIGDVSLIVAVASKHRREGFEACLAVVERIKEIVPIWKKEVWGQGEVWVRSEGV